MEEKVKYINKKNRIKLLKFIIMLNKVKDKKIKKDDRTDTN